MNPIARELNQTIEKNSPIVYSLLSPLGKELFFPKGILTQSAEAKEKAHRFNATIGTATEHGQPMHLSVTRKYFANLQPAEIYPYAPPLGRPKLRELWKEKMLRDNPSLQGKPVSTPAVTAALTHGLSLVADLFVAEGDQIVLPNHLWGNYKLLYQTRYKAEFATFDTFTPQGGFNVQGFIECMAEKAKINGKLILLLNFPNNPTGYTPTEPEAQAIQQAILEQAQKGTKIVTISDDAYFGLFYEDSIKESLFGFLCDLHENICAIKLDGATKEDYAWGFRTGFITLGVKGGNAELYQALEKKVAGAIRGVISNCNHVAQSIIEKALQDPEFPAQHLEKFNYMKDRALEVKRVLSQPKFRGQLEYYPFNSGYFMCLKIAGVDAEDLRVYLLNKFGVGTISIGSTDLRIAFSCIEKEDVQELFDLILTATLELKDQG